MERVKLVQPRLEREHLLAAACVPEARPRAGAAGQARAVGAEAERRGVDVGGPLERGEALAGLEVAHRGGGAVPTRQPAAVAAEAEAVEPVLALGLAHRAAGLNVPRDVGREPRVLEIRHRRGGDTAGAEAEEAGPVR